MTKTCNSKRKVVKQPLIIKRVPKNQVKSTKQPETTENQLTQEIPEIATTSIVAAVAPNINVGSFSSFPNNSNLNSFRKCFHDGFKTDEKKLKCAISGCYSAPISVNLVFFTNLMNFFIEFFIFSQNIATNLKRHISRFHPKEYETILDEENVKKKELEEKFKKQNPSIQKFMKQKNPDLDDVVMMLANGGRPLEILNCKYFQNILRRATPSDIKNSYALNIENVRAILQKAESMRQELIREVEWKLINVNIDFGSYHGHSFLGVVITYLKNERIVNKFLSCREVLESEFGIFVDQDCLSHVLQ